MIFMYSERQQQTSAPSPPSACYTRINSSAGDRTCTFKICWGISAEGQRVRSDGQHRQLAEHQSKDGHDQTFVLGLVQEVGGAVTPNTHSETKGKGFGPL